MAWEDQGRQEHGWFGHGTSGALIDRNDRATQKRLSSGAAIAAMSAYEYLLHQDGKAVADDFDLGRTLPALKALVPVWAGGAHLPPGPFRETLFGKDFAPRPAEDLQTTVQRLIFARTVAAEQAAGEDLAAAVRGIGVAKWQDFLERAQDRVETLQLREKILGLKAQLETSKAAAAAKASAPPPGPKPDGSGDRIKPVYPVETALGIGAAGVAEGAVAAAEAVGGAILRQIGHGAEAHSPNIAPIPPETLPQGLTRPQQGAVTKIDNIIKNGAKEHDFLGVTKELQGEDTGYDHVTEMKNNVRGLRDALASIRGSLNNPHMPPDVRKYMEDALERGQAVLDRMQRALSTS